MYIIKKIVAVVAAIVLAYLYSLNYLEFYPGDKLFVSRIAEPFQARLVSFLAMLTILAIGAYTVQKVKAMHNRSQLYLLFLFLILIFGYSNLFSNTTQLLEFVLKVNIAAVVTTLLIWLYYVKDKTIAASEATSKSQTENQY